MNDKKIVIGLSGGVDSAVACFLLKKQGYDVHAIFMQNWDSFVNNENYDNKKDKCDAQYEWEDAQKIAQHIGVSIEKIDFIEEYWNFVFKYFIDEYKKGRTPNPDILCNKYIKFGFFLSYANKIGYEHIATGHYAKKEIDGKNVLLKKCKDTSKDQTYFLCSLSQEQLSRVVFPLADLTKDEVRKIAKENNIPVWNKKDSTGICFIGERNFKQFMENYIPNMPGDIIDIDNNKIVGKHYGSMYYTIGQNNNLNLGGMKEKYYVCKKNVNQNILYVCKESTRHNHLLSHTCVVNEFNWIYKPTNLNNLCVRFRHRQELIKCNVEIINNSVKIKYPNGSIAVAEGQYAVLYKNDICLGGGAVDVIER